MPPKDNGSIVISVTAGKRSFLPGIRGNRIFSVSLHFDLLCVELRKMYSIQITVEEGSKEVLLEALNGLRENRFRNPSYQ